ncbi:conserved hypothetical protein [Tenacibaculum maritimum]|uniref:hypothetical protein n=1 Tax=Tenacibaculum maritimum TaxID=107401 RepID=UPI0012E4CA68|nr:hypothetical protein [Tenacibaculum maritimum]MCD9582287.1 hypothetical protein [Tenacibaculum maritimum]MCD9636669.1 hypothetical protein [Tenacibaculum maritimum]CAA0144746.1 conserved hypothetical protein [Tenacibaculum maritimum]CAA0193334.1 conserved hypothetical protein [Tenacibaculum maritimum]
MADFVDGLWLEQYVEPQLLEDFRNYNDDFIGVLKRPNAAAIDKDGIKFNKLINNVGFHVNKTDDFVSKPMEGKKGFVAWDKLDTDPTSVTDKELRAMAFDKDAEVRKEHTNSWKLGVRDYVLNKLAPQTHVAGHMPVVRTTGEVFGNRRRMTYSDLMEYYVALETLNLNDKNGWFMILCDHHRADLLHDRANTKNYRDIQIDLQTGELKKFFKLNFFENNDSPFYNAAGTKKSRGAIIGATDQKASTFFYAPNTVYHIEGVEVLKKERKTDTRSADPTSEMRLHSYGLCEKKQDHGFGAIVSDNKPV